MEVFYFLTWIVNNLFIYNILSAVHYNFCRECISIVFNIIHINLMIGATTKLIHITVTVVSDNFIRMMF